MQLEILFIGSNAIESTSRHRADALRRLGCVVEVIDVHKSVANASSLLSKVHYITGYKLLQGKLLQYIQSAVGRLSLKSPALVWVDSGELLGPAAVKFLSDALSCHVILFNVDDPCGARDGARFGSLRSALAFYDHCFFVRWETTFEAQTLGSRNTSFVSRSYDEQAHHPADAALDRLVKNQVSFIGTFIPGENRDKFTLELVRNLVPLTIYGNSWSKSPVFSFLNSNYAGKSLSGKAYSKVISESAVSLGFLSHGNRDLVTQRTFETPACNGLFCAERTSEHQLLYEEGVEAVFWDTAEECAEKCKVLLADLELNHNIRSAGSRRVREMGVGNEDICRQILASVL